MKWVYGLVGQFKSNKRDVTSSTSGIYCFFSSKNLWGYRTI